MDEDASTEPKTALRKRTYYLNAGEDDLFNAFAAQDCRRARSGSFIMREFQRAYNARELVWTMQWGWVYKPKRKRGDASKRKT